MPDLAETAPQTGPKIAATTHLKQQLLKEIYFNVYSKHPSSFPMRHCKITFTLHGFCATFKFEKVSHVRNVL